MTTHEENVWRGEYKIPWHDPDFSRRMLAEHLTQDHDMASRRTEWICRQVQWIHQTLLQGQPARILDLGCGPGFYAHRLTHLGHPCRGIDFGPASIDYAQQHNPDPARCEFLLGDMRTSAFGGPYDLAMILYGELNVFAPIEAQTILTKISRCLTPTGLLIVELQTAEIVAASGQREPVERDHERGVFSNQPHRCRTENQWLADQKVAVQTFTVTDAATSQTQSYRSTTQAWPDAELAELFIAAGLTAPTRRADWPCDNEGLALWTATLPEQPEKSKLV